MKIGRLALLSLGCILQQRDFPPEELERLRDPHYSKSLFGLSYALLIRRREWSKDRPYYAEYLDCNGKYYCLCSSWTERQRKKLEAWVAGKIPEIKQIRRARTQEGDEDKAADHTTELQKRYTFLLRNRKESWVINVEGAESKASLKNIHVTIDKIVVEKLARERKMCCFQQKVGSVYRLYYARVTDFEKLCWSREGLFTESKNDEKWHFCLNPKKCNLYNGIGRPTLWVCYCDKEAITQPLKESVLGNMRQYGWVNYTPKPVSVVKPAFTEKEKVRVRIRRRRKSLNQEDKAQKQKKTPSASAADYVISLQDAGTSRAVVKIPISKCLNKRNRRFLFCFGGETTYYVTMGELLQNLNAKHIYPIKYTHEPCECWYFFADSSGLLYKNSMEKKPFFKLERYNGPIPKKRDN